MKPQQRLIRMFALPALLLVSALASAEPPGESVTIRNEDDKTFYEFRVNGKVQEIKVVPKKGPVYYLVPSDQEAGRFIPQDNPKIAPPEWVIFRW